MSSDKAQEKPSTLSPAMIAGELSISGQMAIDAKSHFLHLNNEGLQGEEPQEPLEAFCQQQQMFPGALCPPWELQASEAFPKEAAS